MWTLPTTATIYLLIRAQKDDFMIGTAYRLLRLIELAYQTLSGCFSTYVQVDSLDTPT